MCAMRKEENDSNLFIGRMILTIYLAPLSLIVIITPRTLTCARLYNFPFGFFCVLGLGMSGQGGGTDVHFLFSNARTFLAAAKPTAQGMEGVVLVGTIFILLSF